MSTVRYGNVMCSRGSVIPLVRGSNCWPANPDHHRSADDTFLMSLDEAVLLVEHAFRARNAGRPLRAEGACMHGAGPGRGRRGTHEREAEIEVIGTQARGETLRDSGDPRRTGSSRRSRRLFPRANWTPVASTTATTSTRVTFGRATPTTITLTTLSGWGWLKSSPFSDQLPDFQKLMRRA